MWKNNYSVWNKSSQLSVLDAGQHEARGDSVCKKFTATTKVIPSSHIFWCRLDCSGLKTSRYRLLIPQGAICMRSFFNTKRRDKLDKHRKIKWQWYRTPGTLCQYSAGFNKIFFCLFHSFMLTMVCNFMILWQMLHYKIYAPCTGPGPSSCEVWSGRSVEGEEGRRVRSSADDGDRESVLHQIERCTCYVYVCPEFAQHAGSKHHTVSIERQETRQLQRYLKLRLDQLGPGDVITAVAQGLCSLWGFFFLHGTQNPEQRPG